jgi:lysine 6-dehydrogenase
VTESIKQVVVLGAGMVGGAIAADLSSEFAVIAADRDANRLAEIAGRWPVRTQVADLTHPAEIQGLIREADLVVGAVPGFMGFRTLQTVIEAGKNVVDISFFDEDPFSLDELAQERGVTAVVDCGVAPGLSNIILGYHTTVGRVTRYRCLVGGLPVKRLWPWQYKAPFSPIDVLEEYTRPARIVEKGAVVVRPALSEAELVQIESIGTLEAFNTDGLRSLIRTMDVPDMVEKTLRYPGHIELVRALADSGFLSREPIDVEGVSVRPIDLAAALLFPQWKLEPGEAEFTVMEVTVETPAQTCRYQLYDTTDAATGISSMARTTGYTCTAVASLVLGGRFTRVGICPPEYVGAADTCFQAVVAYLAERGVNLQ